MGSERHIPGTLFRGADGNLYFIPDTALQPFRIFDQVRDRVEALFDARSEVESEILDDEEAEAVSKADLDAIYTTLTIHEPDPAEVSPSAALFIAFSYLEETGQ